jgi:ATP-dependent Lhr-like helicase
VTDYQARLALKARLTRTWAAFFERHGNFTAVQLAAIPHILDGRNVVISAPTAHGKTEAAIAPLVERHISPHDSGLSVLYLTPTRALANDLLNRLSNVLEPMGVSVAIKTRDQNTFNVQRPAYLLISTPESVDSLLTSQARVVSQLRAVVLDELHLFDGTPRGDQLRVLLNRVRAIRAYAYAQAETPDPTIQYVALSATLLHPEAVAARYFPVDQVIENTDPRPLDAELISMSPESAEALVSYLYTFRSKGWHKTLLFCNSRAEVEAYAAVIRRRSPFGDAVYVHYSNIAPQRRREIEEQFASREVAICCATSTLELGIDIGNIDVVILIGPPGDAQSFLQRIGRGNRRAQVIRVACFYRSPLEKLIFDVLCAVPVDPANAPSFAFRPAVAIQQIFSLLKQSPTASVRLNEVSGLFEGMLASADLAAILGELQLRGYLRPGRPGEWKPDEKLNDLFDQQASPMCELSIYSNIQNSGTRQIEIRDQHTGQPVARVDARWLNRPALTLEGRPITVEWVDGEAAWITTSQAESTVAQLPYRSAQKHLSYDLARWLPRQLGLALGDAPVITAPAGGWWFHWLGDVYGEVLLDLLRYRVRAAATSQPGLCLWLEDVDTFAAPVWTADQVRRYLEDHYRSMERLLDLGPFQHLISPALRRRAVIEQFDVPRFLDAVAALRPLRDVDHLSVPLSDLLITYP